MLFLFWLACTDSATLCAFVYFEWSPCTKNPPVPLKNDARGTPGKSPVLNTDRAYKYRGWVAQTLEIKNTASILLVERFAQARTQAIVPLAHDRTPYHLFYRKLLLPKYLRRQYNSENSSNFNAKWKYLPKIREHSKLGFAMIHLHFLLWIIVHYI